MAPNCDRRCAPSAPARKLPTPFGIGLHDLAWTGFKSLTPPAPPAAEPAMKECP